MCGMDFVEFATETIRQATEIPSGCHLVVIWQFSGCEHPGVRKKRLRVAYPNPPSISLQIDFFSILSTTHKDWLHVRRSASVPDKGSPNHQHPLFAAKVFSYRIILVQKNHRLWASSMWSKAFATTSQDILREDITTPEEEEEYVTSLWLWSTAARV